MAAFNYEDFGRPGDSRQLAAALNWAGAFLSVVLIAGLATWGWKLWVRDVSGVPVVRALEGPMRAAPEDPGGLATEYQGLSVNRIAEERTEDTLADRVVLAPQPSVLDEEEDLSMAELQPLIDIDAQEKATAVIGAEADLTDAAPAEIATAPVFAAEDDKVATLTVPEPAASAAEEDASGTDMAVMLALGLADDEAGVEPAVASVTAAPGVPVVTPRPILRPENLQAVSYTPDAGEVEPASIPAGTRLVQLGAFGSAEMARTEWDATLARFGSYMAGKERVVQEAQTGGRTFWRLRAMGFSDLSDARRFCSVLVADGANCIPVVQE